MFLKFHNILKFTWFSWFSCFYIKNWKRTPPRARTPRSFPNHWNTKQIHRSWRGAIRPEILKITQIHFFALFGEFPPRINKNGEILQFPVNLAKRGSLGGPARRSLFFLRNIKVSEPPEYRKLVRNCYFLEFPWNFMKFPDFHDFCGIFIFWGNFTIFGVLERLESSRGA